MEINLTAFVSVAGIVCSIAFGYLGYTKGKEKEVKKEAQEDGEFGSDMRYVVKRVDDILLEQKDTNKSISALTERVTRVEESAKQAHKRLDGMEVKEHG